MPIDRKTAEEISKLFSKASDLCESSLRTVMSNESLGQVQVYGRLVGSFMGNSYTNVLAPLRREFPDLEPRDMKEPYVEPQPTLTQESQKALRTFLTEARTALHFAREAVSSDEADNYFRFEKLEEIEEAVIAIESFLEHPRFRGTDKT